MVLPTAVYTMHRVYAMYKVYSILGYISCMRYMTCISYVNDMYKLFQNENSIEISVFNFHGICRKNYFMSRFIHIRLILEMFCGFTSFVWGIL